MLLLFTFVMTNEGQIDNQSESIYEPQTEEFEKSWNIMFTPLKEDRILEDFEEDDDELL